MTVPRKIRIFLSSPSDLDDEPHQCAAVVQELNMTLSVLVPDKDVHLELVRWENPLPS